MSATPAMAMGASKSSPTVRANAASVIAATGVGTDAGTMGGIAFMGG
ncbi:MAG: hypothetical protein WDM87_15055 [Terracidiphilus sp.]